MANQELLDLLKSDTNAWNELILRPLVQVQKTSCVRR